MVSSYNFSMALRLLVIACLLLNVVHAQDVEGGGGEGGGGGGGGGGGEECDKDFDLTFVIDGSGSIEQAGRGNFNRVKDFVKRVVKGFRIGSDQTHVGAVIYSSSRYVRDVFKLDDHYDIAGIDRAIDRMIYPSGGTYTGKALTRARTSLYTSSADRSDKPNVCIVITDGKANDEIAGPARALRDKETKIFAIGVGRDFDRSELEVMAGDPSNVFTADFNELGTVIEQIKRSACQGLFVFTLNPFTPKSAKF
ncbi:Cartilage matrix protein [Desmophyllum pertusum]|uniref:Cartilage matrix protein n=1 Tax=Desmophyllum pertusum TaxID=174260 RepID=A0A9W9YMV7_9CNID|nr:Cartilage matrix protein [Desmophyllum pertusum]